MVTSVMIAATPCIRVNRLFAVPSLGDVSLWLTHATTRREDGSEKKVMLRFMRFNRRIRSYVQCIRFKTLYRNATMPSNTVFKQL